MIAACENLHAAAKLDEQAFRASVTNPREWPEAPEHLGYRLLVGECVRCRSTIALELPAEAPAQEAA